jgi:hypothetical protein
VSLPQSSCVCVLYKRKNKKLRKKSKGESLGHLREKGSNKQNQRKERQGKDPLLSLSLSLSLVSHPFFCFILLTSSKYKNKLFSQHSMNMKNKIIKKKTFCTFTKYITLTLFSS